MSLTNSLRSWLKDRRLEGVDIDSPRVLDVHRQILSEKAMMRDVFNEFYDECIVLRDRYLETEGMEIELGAGVSLFKERYPHVLSTDIKPSPYLNQVLDAQNMDVSDESVRAIYGLNCFHHFPEPRKFLSELQRVLVPRGGCVLIEPYFGPFAKRLYTNVHAQEHFNPNQEEWEAFGTGFMSGANQALAYMVFVRDRHIFEKEFPGLELVHLEPLSNHLRYLLSGGVNFRQLAPDWSIAALKGAETLLKPVRKMIALHYAVVVRKKSG